MEQKTSITIDNFSVFAPVIAASLINAFYTALLLKKENGEEATTDLREKTLEEVVTLWATLQESIAKQSLNPIIEKKEN